MQQWLIECFKFANLLTRFSHLNLASRVLCCIDDANTKVVLFAFSAGSGLTEHVAPFPAIIQVIKGEAALTVGNEQVGGKPGTWIRMAAGIPHSITAESPVVMLLTLLK